MASVEKTVEVVQKVVTVDHEVETFNLKLSRDEADFLTWLLGDCISGRGDDRALSDSIYYALKPQVVQFTRNNSRAIAGHIFLQPAK